MLFQRLLKWLVMCGWAKKRNGSFRKRSVCAEVMAPLSEFLDKLRGDANTEKALHSSCANFHTLLVRVLLTLTEVEEDSGW